MNKPTKAEKKAGMIRKEIAIDNGSMICTIDLTKTEIDEYQRNLVNSHLNIILKDYDDKARKLPTLSFRDGKLWRVDGNHTINARLKKGENITHCEVFFDLDIMAEADLFYLRNTGTRRMTPWVAWKSALIAGRIEQTNIQKVIDRLKMTTPLSNSKDADLKSCSILTDVYSKKHGSEKALVKFLTILKGTYRISPRNQRLQHEAKNVQFLRGLASFLIEHPEITAKDYIEAMANFTAGEIQSQALQIGLETETSRADKLQNKKAIEFMYFVSGKRVLSAKKKKA